MMRCCLLWVSIACLLMGETASACPLCDSPTGGQVRAGIFDGDFWYTLAALLVPFALALGVTALVYWGGGEKAKSQIPNPKSQ